MIGVFATPALAEPAAKRAEATGFWAYSCQSGRACIQSNLDPVYPSWWNFDGCGHHGYTAVATWGQAHGNRFRVTYQDGRWDDVAAWSGRALDRRNDPRSVWVYC